MGRHAIKKGQYCLFSRLHLSFPSDIYIGWLFTKLESVENRFVLAHVLLRDNIEEK